MPLQISRGDLEHGQMPAYLITVLCSMIGRSKTTELSVD